MQTFNQELSLTLSNPSGLYRALRRFKHVRMTMAHALDFELPEQLTVGFVQAIHEQLETLVDDKKNDHIICKRPTNPA